MFITLFKNNFAIVRDFQTVFSNFFHGQMLFHAKALELYTTAFQSLVSMDEEQDIEVSYLFLLIS